MRLFKRKPTREEHLRAVRERLERIHGYTVEEDLIEAVLGYDTVEVVGASRTEPVTDEMREAFSGTLTALARFKDG